MLVITSMMLRFTNDVLDPPNLHILTEPFLHATIVLVTGDNCHPAISTIFLHTLVLGVEFTLMKDNLSQLLSKASQTKHMVKALSLTGV